MDDFAYILSHFIMLRSVCHFLFIITCSLISRILLQLKTTSSLRLAKSTFGLQETTEMVLQERKVRMLALSSHDESAQG